MTTLTGPAAIVRLHFVDSLLCLRAGIPEGARVVDVGSGAGLPGIPLKIARPDLDVALLEPARRKAAFLELAAAELELAVTVRTERAETAAHDPAWREAFGVATARAVASLPVVLEFTLPLAQTGGRVVLLKGPSVTRELVAGRKVAQKLGGGELEIMSTRLAGGEKRVLVVVPKVAPTPPGFPRRAGVPAKRPIG